MTKDVAFADAKSRSIDVIDDVVGADEATVEGVGLEKGSDEASSPEVADADAVIHGCWRISSSLIRSDGSMRRHPRLRSLHSI